MEIPFHIAKKDDALFFLRQEEKGFVWTQVEKGVERALWSASSLEGAIALAKEEELSFIACGMRYMVEPRDEVGNLAFFWQMAKSYQSSSGQYFDESVGYTCFVDFASQEALNILKLIDG